MGVEEGVINSVYLGGMFYKRDDICVKILCVEKRRVYFRQRKYYVQRYGGLREYDMFVVRILDMCCWEGVVDEVKMIKGF